jgi:hypothetical protein
VGQSNPGGENQAAIRPFVIEGVAVNIDTRGAEKAKAWTDVASTSSTAIPATPRCFSRNAFGMPTTLIVDGNGCELATLAGPAEWASGDAVKLVTAALGK